MPITMPTDQGAAHHAELAIYDVLDRAEQFNAEDDEWQLPLDLAAKQVVCQFIAHWEHRDGLRRVVLTGGWEVDPNAVTARQVAST
ncbi:hypothetical protein ABGB07_36265 [Micromonosporaceae bacterium B7E4]